MNKNLVELNENCGMAVDENGNITIITKENSEHEFKEILERENELETIGTDFSDVYDKYTTAKINLKSSRLSNIVIVTFTLLLAGLLGFTNSGYYLTVEELIAVIGTGTFFKLMSVQMFGTAIGNKKKIKNLKGQAASIHQKDVTLEKQLDDIKEKVNYSAVDKTTNKFTFTPHEYNSIETDVKETGKVRVLSLNKKR